VTSKDEANLRAVSRQLDDGENAFAAGRTRDASNALDRALSIAEGIEGAPKRAAVLRMHALNEKIRASLPPLPRGVR
jgi:predicted  nucleic acid-binding Zn-ribbon protein